MEGRGLAVERTKSLFVPHGIELLLMGSLRLRVLDVLAVVCMGGGGSVVGR